MDRRILFPAIRQKACDGKLLGSSWIIAFFDASANFSVELLTCSSGRVFECQECVQEVRQARLGKCRFPNLVKDLSELASAIAHFQMLRPMHARQIAAPMRHFGGTGLLPPLGITLNVPSACPVTSTIRSWM